MKHAYTNKKLFEILIGQWQRRLRNSLYDWCAIILPLVNDPNGVSAKDFGIPKSIHSNRIYCDSLLERKTIWLYTPYHHLSKKATVMLMITLCWQLFNVDTLKILVPGSWQNSVTNRSSPTQTNISCLQHRCSPKTKTLTENQFSIFFSFSPKLSPFLSFQNSIAFLLQVHCTTIWKKCQKSAAFSNIGKIISVSTYYPVTFKTSELYYIPGLWCLLWWLVIKMPLYWYFRNCN